ncbi:hypothetical protein AB0M19_29910 [Streptomyces sp. NPDC051920]|uniref:hypothetical protein n=1 Tax=Streptomyces sp. NPDC051920 TaxID=3155523 RepID=UPI003417E057
MTEGPVPLPPELLPVNATAWLSPDAERWRALRPGHWAHPLLAAAAMVLASYTAFWLAPQDAYLCDGRGACTREGIATVVAALVVAVVCRGIRLLPLATAAVLPPVALWALLDPATPTVAGIIVAVAACYACLGCLHRLAAAHRQRRLALETAGPERHAPPQAAMTRQNGGEQLGCGIVLVAAAALALFLGSLGATASWGPGGWQQTVVFFGTLTGVLNLAYHVSGRRRAAALHSGPLPALRVLVRQGGGRNDRRTYVFAADDIEGRRPLLGCYTRLADGEFRAPVHNRLREAVLFGPPHPGGGLVLLSSDGRQVPGPCVEYGTGPARQEHREDRPESPAPGATPLSWGPGTGSRWCAVLGQVALIALVVGDLAVLDGIPVPGRVYLALLVLACTPVIATQLSWRVTADSAGLWAVGMRRVRLIPWDELGQVWLHGRGFNIHRSDRNARGAEHFGVVAPAWLADRFRRRPAALRAVDNIRALQADPTLRPTGQSAPETRGRPVGLALFLVNTALVIVLLAFG